jgi:hypothetical protein
MDYGTAYTKERLTGRGYFFPTATPTQGLDLGNIQMLESDFGIKRKEHYSARRGVLNMDRYDSYSSMGAWHITVDEFTTPTLALLWGGTANANFTQSSATGSTFMFTSKKGAAFDVGKYGLNNATLTTPVSKVEPGDYIVDRAGGKVYIPLASTIADATACTLTYDAPALTYDSVTALNTLNRVGILELQGEDDSQAGIGAGAGAVAPVRYLWNFPCILSIDKSGQFKPDNYRESILIATLTSAMTVKRLTT